ncbi:GTPase [Pedococcus sp.]|uniref:GTPase n=1 Tax=Pedococcus sp. TaxID=2860345 RepID=UPI002E12FD67|nr:GTPase [Pedococcus sp.]
MSPLKMGNRQAPAMTAEDLALRARALGDALGSGQAELDQRAVEAAREVIVKIGERTSKTGGHTVVALAGATGSGKSSLFNCLVGAPVALVGARRPTTSRPVAAVWGDEDASELLDWLGVSQRHHVAGATGSEGAVGSLDGLVLLDLPDFDSRVIAHREEAERVLALVDVFVWVTDPQKYADARLHEDHLAALATHDAVTLVVLNQSDRLTDEEVGRVRDDLVRLAQADGIGTVRVFTTSATTSAGVADLRLRLAAAVAGQNAARHRLAADVKAAAGRVRAGVADSEPALADDADDDLVEALGRAAGIPTVVAAVERDYRLQAWGRTGWPYTRWVRGLRPDPMRRLRLDDRASVDPTLGITAADVRSVLGRSSLPPPSPAARSAVELATRALGDDTARGLPPRWAEAVADAATPPGPDLADALDQAVVSTSLKMRPPWWWRVFGVTQLVLAAVTVLGLGWLLVRAVMSWLALPPPGTPRLGVLPVPLLMVVGGLVLGLVLSTVSRQLARRGARRRGERIRQRLLGAVAGVAGERIVEPVRVVLARHRDTRRALDRATS